MNDCAGLQASIGGDCISLPLPYERQLAANSSFWNPQQQQQIAFNNNNGANIQRNQQLFDTPTTSQNGNFDITGQQQQQIPQFTTEGRSPNISSPYFNPSQQQLKQFQDSQRKSAGVNIYQQQQQDFQRPNSNFSSGQFMGNEQHQQQKIQQQISSPSVSSTADLLVSNGGNGNGGQVNIQQNFLPHFQMPPNGMFDPQSNNNNNGRCSIDVNNPANFNMNGNSNSPMFRQAIQMNNNGQQSIPSPLIGQQHPQMMIPQQQLWQGMPPNMRMPPNVQQQIVGTNGSELEAPPFQKMPNNGAPFGRFSFLFNSKMANAAVLAVKQRQVPDFAHWHAQFCADWHMANPSTSNAFYGSQTHINPMQLSMRINDKSPHPSIPSTSRSNKRKASSQSSTIQEQQQNSLCSPSQINNNFPLPQVSICNNNNNPNIQNNMVLQRFGSKDVCDSSTNNGADINNMLFKRPDNNLGNDPMTNRQDYFCLNPGNQIQNVDGSSGRLDDENPLKKMEIMASKTLNEQPSNKMARLIGDEEENNFNKLNNQQQQQQTCEDPANMEKLRKLEEMERVIVQFSSFDNSNLMPNSLIQQQQFVQMQNSNFLQQQNGGTIPNNNFPPQFQQQLIDSNNIEMGGGGGQFRPPFFPPNMIPPTHFNPMLPMNNIQQLQQFNNSNNIRLPMTSQQIFCTEAQLIQQQKIGTINSNG